MSYRSGGGHWDGPRAPLGFTVTNSDHWVFSGTGLKTGDIFGRDGALIGYECDGAAYETDEQGRPRPTGQDGTPKDFEILGVAQLPTDWNFAAREPMVSPRAATLGLYTAAGDSLHRRHHRLGSPARHRSPGRGHHPQRLHPSHLTKGSSCLDSHSRSA